MKETITGSTTTIPRSTLTLRRIELAHAESAATSIWQPVGTRSEALTTSDVIAQAKPPQPLSQDLEAAIVTVLTRPLRADENHRVGFANIEAELYQVLSRLDQSQSRDLARRLERDDSSDPTVAAFHRLVLERRVRACRYLASARRRQACHAGRVR